jgi:hypothetical protein
VGHTQHQAPSHCNGKLEPDASKPELRLVRKDEPVITADVVDIDDSNMEWNTSYDLDGVTVTNNAKFVKID